MMTLERLRAWRTAGRLSQGARWLAGRLGGQRAALLAASFEADDRPWLVAGPAGMANAAFQALCGGSDFADLQRHVATDPNAAEALARLADSAARGVRAADEIGISRDGRSEWLMIRARPLADPGRHVLWQVEDITARCEIEAIIRDEHAKLVDFMDHSPVGFCAVDEEGRFQFANATLAGWLGSTSRDLVLGGVALHTVLEAPPAGGRPFDVIPGGGEEQRGDVTMLGTDGRRFRASIAQTVVAGESGGVRTRTVMRDLTQEQEWQEALRLSEQRFQKFFEDAPIAIARVDVEGRLAECNRAFLALVGSSHEAAIGQPVGDFLQGEGAVDIVTRIRGILTQSEMPPAIEVRLVGGRDRVVQLYVRRLGSDGLMLHFIDMSDQRRLEVQFAQSQKMQAIGQLAGGIAHDFNNLLTAMIGFCDLLLLRHRPGDQSFTDIMQIKQNANRAANLVRQLLAFSRQQTLQPRVIAITDVLAELSSLLRRLIGENIELRMMHGRDVGLVKVDQGQFEQVIINLVVNARDAMPQGGRITIATGNLSSASPARAFRRGQEEIPPGDYVFVEVADTGIGIPEENLARIFEPFFSTKEVGSGTGLGLSTVYGIVRQTGGFVAVDSAPGEGAKFAVLLPRYVESRDAEAPATEAAGTRQGDLTGAGTILLVEDEDAVRVFSARALRNKGYTVLEARSGDSALALLEDSAGPQVDLVITDVVMPQMDGPTLVRHIRETRPELKVIFISGYAEDRFLDQLDPGMSVQFLAKPFSLKQLAAKVKEVIRGAA